MGEDFSARSLLLLNLPLFFSFVEFNSRLCFDLHPFSFLHGPPNRHPTTPDALESISGPADVISHPCPSLSLSLSFSFYFLFFYFFRSSGNLEGFEFSSSHFIYFVLWNLLFLLTCVPGAKLFMLVWSVGAGGGDEKTYSHRLSYWRFDVSVRWSDVLSSGSILLFFFCCTCGPFHRIHLLSLSFFSLSQSYFYSRPVDKRG